VDERTIARLLDDVAAGRTSVDDAVVGLRDLPYESVPDARVDHHRELRTGQPETVYGPGKTPTQVADIARSLAAGSSGAVLVTRATADQAAAVRAAIPEAEFHERSRVIVVKPAQAGAPPGEVVVVSAGTSDGPIADEAAITLGASGCRVNLVMDVGVAGIHRVLEHRAAFDRADCVVVVAGMEGALPSVVAGLTSTPVVAVPTSVGYGASFEGLAALLGMLSSCAPGVAVVNIDNGFGAAQVALRIARAARRGESER
jgi:pyridinium-3,5-biscarboxylic acid mononucleotide synthase